MNASVPSQTPYLIRALWQWCVDAGLSPQILVAVDNHTQVPSSFVQSDQIVFDISTEATNLLDIGNDWITFQARFGTAVEHIAIPIGNVLAIYAEETQQGMMFDFAPLNDSPQSTVNISEQSAAESNQPRNSSLKIVK